MTLTPESEALAALIAELIAAESDHVDHKAAIALLGDQHECLRLLRNRVVVGRPPTRRIDWGRLDVLQASASLTSMRAFLESVHHIANGCADAIDKQTIEFLTPTDRALVEPLVADAVERSMPDSLDELLVELALSDAPPVRIARWRDEYARLHDVSRGEFRDHVDACLNVLIARECCWDCGRPGWSMSHGLWACPDHPVAA